MRLRKNASSQIEEEFKSNCLLYNRLREEAEFILKTKLERERIKLHGIECRIKSFESFLQKIKRKKCKKPFSEVKDIVGLRVICLFRDDIKRIEKVITQSFEIASYEDKINQSADYFGYMSAHFIVRLQGQLSGPRYDNLKNQFFEIQVRTLAMHSWASISHYLDYKNETDVPDDFKKSLNALSALFYVADTQFESIYQEREKSLSKLQIANADDLNRQEINFDSLMAYILKNLSKREYNDLSDISELVEQLKKNNFLTIDQLDKEFRRNIKYALLSEKDSPPVDEETNEKTIFTATGIIRKALGKGNNNFNLSDFE